MRFHDVAVIDDSDTSPPRFSLQWSVDGDVTPRRTVYRVDRRPFRPGNGYEYDATMDDGDEIDDAASAAEQLAADACDAWHDGGPAFERLRGRVQGGEYDVEAEC